MNHWKPARLAELEEEIAELRREIAELRAIVADGGREHASSQTKSGG